MSLRIIEFLLAMMFVTTCSLLAQNERKLERAAEVNQADLDFSRRCALARRDLESICKVDSARAVTLEKRLRALGLKRLVLMESAGKPIGSLSTDSFSNDTEWKRALSETLSQPELASWHELIRTRKTRLAIAQREFVVLYGAAVLRTTPAQLTKLQNLCVDPIASLGGRPPLAGVIRWLSDEFDERVFTRVQLTVASTVEGRSRGAVMDYLLEAERIRILADLDEEAVRLLVGAAQRAKPILRKQGRPQRAPLISDRPSKDQFWQKVKQSILGEKTESVAAHPLVTPKELELARLGLFIAELEHVLHLDAQQIDSLREFFAKLVNREIKANGSLPWSALHLIGVKQPSTDHRWNFGIAEARSAKLQATQEVMDDILDRDQQDALRDLIR